MINISLNSGFRKQLHIYYFSDGICRSDCQFTANVCTRRFRPPICLLIILSVERPEYGSKIKVETWARPIEKRPFSTYRDFKMFNNGKISAIGTSKWILFDLETNKIAKITEDIIDLYKTEPEKVFEKDEIEKLKEVDELNSYIEYDVKRSDIDVNKHMHNLNYLKLAYEALPEEVYYSKEKDNVRIMYKHQILLGDKVKCYYTNIENKDIITIKSKDDSILHAIVELS